MSRVGFTIAPNTDHLTGFDTQITGDHRYIHEERAFGIINNTGAVAAGASYSFAFKTPAASTGKYVHLRPASIFATENATSILITEGAVVTGGTALTPYNFNRLSTRASAVTVTKGVTISTPGTQVIYADYTGTSGGPNVRSGGGSGGSEHERVLKADTVYTITFTVIGASTASTAYLDLFWYEEDAGI